MKELSRAIQNNASNFALMSDVFQNIPIMIAILDTKLNYIMVSQKYLDYIHATANEVLNKNVKSVLPPDIVKKILPFLQEALQGNVVSYELELEDNSDDKRIMSIMYQPRYNMRREQTGIFMSGIEITGLKKTEQEKQHIQEYLNATFESISHGMIIVDKQHKVVAYNHQAQKLLGIPIDDISMYLTSEDRDYFKVLENFGWETSLVEAVEGIEHPEDSRLYGDHLINKNQQYLNVKNNLFHSGGYCVVLTDVTEQLKHKQHLLHLATHDSLTQLPNRFFITQRIEQESHKCKRSNTLAALVFIDLDHFKMVNDTYGHHFGDRLLMNIADRLKEICRAIDTVARFAGDEFLVLATGFANLDQIDKHVNRIFTMVPKNHTAENVHLKLSTSVGVAILPDDGDNAYELLRKADMALYHSKSKGRNLISYFNPQMEALTRKRSLISNNLKSAMENHEIYVVFQPIYNKNKEIIAIESLARWESRDIGFIPPDEFLDIAAVTNQIIELGDFLINQTLRHARRCYDTSGKTFKIAINASPMQLDNIQFAQHLIAACQKYNIDTTLIYIEITENAVFNYSKNQKQVIDQLRTANIKLAIDDFGTGFSSLTLLNNLPFEILKIDKSFFMGNINDKSRSLIQAIGYMAEKMGIDVVAEGIENIADFDFATKSKCIFFQGYYLSKPLQPEKFISLLCESH